MPACSSAVVLVGPVHGVGDHLADGAARGSLVLLDQAVQQVLVGHLAGRDVDGRDDPGRAAVHPRVHLVVEVQRHPCRATSPGVRVGAADDLQAWCEVVSQNVPSMTYAQKRNALDALGVSVRAWRTDHEPRYQVEASIPRTSSIVSTASATSGSACKPR